MNPSNLYEQYFYGISRRIKLLTTESVNTLSGLESMSDRDVDNVFAIVLEGIELFGTEQYDSYTNTTTDERREILDEIYHKECYIYYKVSSRLRPHEVVSRALGTKYEPFSGRFVMPTTDNPTPELSSGKVMIAPQYIILLAKTPEQYLATSSSKTNHYDLPISVGPKMRQHVPYRNSPVKILSETETRLYSAYVGRKGLAEMKDRANSTITHRMVYENILNADKPTDIDCLVDREQHPFGTDKAIELAESILNASGIKLTYVKENNDGA